MHIYVHMPIYIYIVIILLLIVIYTCISGCQMKPQLVAPWSNPMSLGPKVKDDDELKVLQCLGGLVGEVMIQP